MPQITCNSRNTVELLVTVIRYGIVTQSDYIFNLHSSHVISGFFFDMSTHIIINTFQAEKSDSTIRWFEYNRKAGALDTVEK